MNFEIQFLDGSRAVVAEWRHVAQDTARAIELTQDVRWPAARHGWKYSMRTDSRFIGG